MEPHAAVPALLYEHPRVPDRGVELRVVQLREVAASLKLGVLQDVSLGGDGEEQYSAFHALPHQLGLGVGDDEAFYRCDGLRHDVRRHLTVTHLLPVDRRRAPRFPCPLPSSSPAWRGCSWRPLRRPPWGTKLTWPSLQRQLMRTTESLEVWRYTPMRRMTSPSISQLWARGPGTWRRPAGKTRPRAGPRR